MAVKRRVNKAKEQLTETEWDFLRDDYDRHDRTDALRWWTLFLLEHDKFGNATLLWNETLSLPSMLKTIPARAPLSGGNWMRHGALSERIRAMDTTGS